MRIAMLLLLTLSLGIPCAAQSTATLDNPLIVQVGVFTLQPDGSVGGYAVETGERLNEPFAARITTDGCRVSAARSRPGEAAPSWARDAWEVSGRVLSWSPDQAVLQLDWRRVRAAGIDVADSAASVQLVLSPDRVTELDIPSGPAPNCALVRPVVFGARYSARLPPGGIIVIGSGTQTSGVVKVAQLYDAELWLIRSLPGQPAQVVSTRTRVANGEGAFDFGALQVPVTGGGLMLRVSGQLRVVVVGQMLTFHADRTATFMPANRPPRDPKAPVKGNAVVTRPLPGPDDVLEFQMPPIEGAGLPEVPDAFSIRLRIRPASGRY